LLSTRKLRALNQVYKTNIYQNKRLSTREAQLLAVLIAENKISKSN